MRPTVFLSLIHIYQKKITSQKVVIIILVILLVAAAAAVTLLIFKIKDMTDAADFSDAEEAALRRRRVDRPQTGRGQGGRPAPQGGRTQGCLLYTSSDAELLGKLKAYSTKLKEQVEAKDAKLQEIGYKAYLEGMKK